VGGDLYFDRVCLGEYCVNSENLGAMARADPSGWLGNSEEDGLIVCQSVVLMTNNRALPIL
jgi:hypothetical protein